MIIYKTTNLINGKIYIGKDSRNNPQYYGGGKILLQAIKKYGKHSFIKEIVETCESEKQLNEREPYWITFYNSRDPKIGYNITLGGESGNKGKLSERIDGEEIRKKIKDGLKNANIKRRKGKDHPYFGKKSPASGTKWNDEQKSD